MRRMTWTLTVDIRRTENYFVGLNNQFTFCDVRIH